MKKLYYSLRIFFVLCAAGYIFLLKTSTIPPFSKTIGSMTMIKRRILLNAAKTNNLVIDLDKLPEIPGKINSSKDGWGQKIID